eukprot:4605481-Pleurochrysis_carterae.AAC.2
MVPIPRKPMLLASRTKPIAWKTSRHVQCARQSAKRSELLHSERGSKSLRGAGRDGHARLRVVRRTASRASSAPPPASRTAATLARSSAQSFATEALSALDGARPPICREHQGADELVRPMRGGHVGACSCLSLATVRTTLTCRWKGHAL